MLNLSQVVQEGLYYNPILNKLAIYHDYGLDNSYDSTAMTFIVIDYLKN